MRQELRQRSMIGTEEREFMRLVPLQWTEAQRADQSNYSGEEILQYHRNCSAYKAGEQVRSVDALNSCA